MKTFDVIEHTADVAISVSADSLHGVFQGGLDGMNFILSPGYRCNKHTQKEHIHVASVDTSGLLVEMLSEILYHAHCHNAIFCCLNDLYIARRHLSANISGSTVGTFQRDVKAVTYHDAYIIKDSLGMYSCTLVFDI